MENKKSKYKGVSWYKKYNKWATTVWHNNKKYHVGYFDDEIEAAKAYNQKAIELKGKRAKLNFEGEKVCEVCGDIALYFYKDSMYLCKKHISQMNNYGEILTRTKFDKNKIIQYENYAEIVLYDINNEEIDRTQIDIDMIDHVKDLKWYLKENGYVATNKTTNFNQYIHLHQFIFNKNEKEEIFEVDHIDGNKLNNRLSNLRMATRSQNEQNKGLRNHNTSGVTGVRFTKERGDWHAGIAVDGKRIHLGYFNSFDEAVKARKNAELKYFKEFRYKQN